MFGLHLLEDQIPDDGIKDLPLQSQPLVRSLDVVIHLHLAWMYYAPQSVGLMKNGTMKSWILRDVRNEEVTSDTTFALPSWYEILIS